MSPELKPQIDRAVLSPEAAAAAFDAAERAEPPRGGDARLAILDSAGRIVFASPSALRLFEAKDQSELKSRLLPGDGPNARRLRHLAATLPVGEAPRLEHVRTLAGRRPLSLNLRCARVSSSEGTPLLLLWGPDRIPATTQEPIAPPEPALPEPASREAPTGGATPPANARFLWSLDRDGRLGAADPVLIMALGSNAPQPGETLEALSRRLGSVENGDLIRAVLNRETFSDVSVLWPLAGSGRQARIKLSAASVFDRGREFAGFKGFGRIASIVEPPDPARHSLPPNPPVVGLGPEEAATDLEPAGEAPKMEGLAPRTEPAAETLPVGAIAGAANRTVDPTQPFRSSSEAAADESQSPRTLPESAAAEPGERIEPATVRAEPWFEAHSETHEASPETQLNPSAVPNGREPVFAWPESSAEETGVALGAGPAAAPAENFAETREQSAEPSRAWTRDPKAPESGAALPENGGGAAAAEGTSPAPAIPGGSAGESAAGPATAPPERTAEIYVLRQTHGAPSKIVPMRPGALEALTPVDPGAGSSESVELSKSERDAFREIARALGGRPGPRAEAGSEVAGPAAEGSQGPNGGEKPEAFAPAAARPAEERPREPRIGFGEPLPRNAAAILDRLPIGVMVARDARALYLNHTLLDLLSYRDFAHFESSNGLMTMFAGRDPQAMSESNSSAVAIVRADGRALKVDGHAQAVIWDGLPATLIAFRRLREAETEDRRPSSERAQRGRSAEELEAMLAHAADGAVALDPAGRIVSLNRPAERLFGYAEGEVAGESVLMLLQPQSHPETTARLETLSRDGAEELARPFSVVGRDRAGAALPLALTLARIGSPEAPHFCALLRDLRSERDAERRLMTARDAALAASAAKTDFLAHVSHEIRTPLHAILGFAEVMMEERFGPIGNERYKDYLKDIHASGKHVMSLADDLLDLSKIESGKFELDFAPVDTNGLIRECVALMQPQASRERIIMRVSLFDTLPRVVADERSLKQIMLNLISNAVKFNAPGGQVIVSTALDSAGQTVIRVRDTGVGMSESEVGVALEPFGQIGAAARKGGAGLGLPLTKALVEANGAEFSIKSRREHGTLIEIAFPSVKAAQ